MALADFWEVRIRMEYLGATDLLSVFHMRQTSAVSNTEDICNVVVSDFIPTLKAAVSINVGFLDVTAVNLADRFKVAIVGAGNAVGTFGGSPLPRFMTLAYTVAREINDVRHGYKRFPGVSEDHMTNAIPTSTALTVLNALAVKMPQVWGSLLEWHIIKRIKYTPPGKTTPRWRLPQTDAELVTYRVKTSPFKGFTTQNTRKR